MNPFVHLFKTPGGYYLYDVNRNVILNLSEDQYKIIDYYIKGDICKNISEFDTQALESINHLYELGFLSEKRPKEMYHPINDTLINHLNNKVSMITLQVTRQCNLRCKYCVYSGNYENREHSSQNMNFETARKGIDFYIEHSKHNDIGALTFYGGEPLIEFELIKKCIEYFEEKSEGKEIFLSITTNATLLTEEIVDYFQKHNLSLIISLDGPSHIHNKNRVYGYDDKGTFEKVMENLNMIKNKFPDYLKQRISFNAVLDPESEFGCINKFFTDFETVKNSNIFANEISSLYRKETLKKTDTYVRDTQYEYFKLFLAKLGYLDEKYTSKLVWKHYSERRNKYNRLKMTKELPDRMHHGGPCIPGIQRLFMDVDGNFYPCERVSETSPHMKIGHINEGFDVDKVKTLLNIGKVTENRCINCWALRFCKLCAAAADENSELSTEKKVSRCSFVLDSTEDMLKDICTLKEFGAQLIDKDYAFDLVEWKV